MTHISEVLASEKRLGYKVMHHENGKAVSKADSRQAFDLRKGEVVRFPGKGIWLALKKEYVLDYYRGGGSEVLLTFEFDPRDLTAGNLTDREAEFAVSEAVLKDFEILPDED